VPSEVVPLFSPEDPRRPIAFRHGRRVDLAEFRRDVARVVSRLPAENTATAMIDLCEDRYRFLVAYAAAASVGHVVLLPSSRAEQVVAEVEASNPGSYRCEDATVDAALANGEACTFNERIDAQQTVMIGFTSGSTGQPKTFPKLWRTVAGSNANNAAAIRRVLDVAPADPVWLLATVPPQHMYGMELSVLLPLMGGMAVHSGRPLFPADIALALEELPTPRVLVSTPVHLRTLVESNQPFPKVGAIISATAPLDQALARAVEDKLGGTMLEMFGSTETCVFARRRTAHEERWRLYEGVRVRPEQNGTIVSAPWFVEPVPLQDVLDVDAANTFVVRGRNTDMIEVAGKRASLADLTRRLLAIEGVRDAVVFQPDQDAVATIRRVAAAVVAPGLTPREILERLAPSVDPAFMPRPLVVVDALPRNELGKLPRERLLSLLGRKK
jgi:acyl-coenzyme A synthetase/AMP-(fatty) acid ligase